MELSEGTLYSTFHESGDCSPNPKALKDAGAPMKRHGYDARSTIDHSRRRSAEDREGTFSGIPAPTEA